MQSGNYGAKPIGLTRDNAPKSVFAPAKRRSINLWAICVNIFLPWALFSTLFSIQSFNFHYTHPILTWVIVLASFVFPLVAGFWGYQNFSRENDFPAWYVFQAIALFVAVCLAMICGDINYWLNMQPYLDMQNLNTYPAVNPAVEKSAQLQDSGRVYFTSGTHLKLEFSMGFKNGDMHCVAPIVIGDKRLPTYDFWAVGTNCCNGNEMEANTVGTIGKFGTPSQFHCGDYHNPHARSGLRLMNQAQVPFYTLAVQQAEAAYNLNARHPLFFHWMQDPLAEVNAYRDEAYKYYTMGVATYFACHLFCVICAVVGFAKMGPSWPNTN